MADTPPDPPTFAGLIEAAKFLALPTMAAAMGLFTRWADDLRRGNKITWRRVLFETPTLIGFGIMGGGIGAWISAPEPTVWAIASVFGYLGTQGVIDLVMRWHVRKCPPSHFDKHDKQNGDKT